MAQENATDENQTLQKSCPGIEERVVINVGGRRFETLESTLQRLPQSLLADKQRRAAYYDASRGELFLDRSSACFDAVLSLYQRGCGAAQRPAAVPPQLFLDELEFYGVRDYVSSLNGVPSGKPLVPAGWRGQVWTLLEPGLCRLPLLPLLSALVTLLIMLAWTLMTVRTLLHHASAGFTVQQVGAGLLLLELIVRVITCPRLMSLVTDPLTWVDLLGTLVFLIGSAFPGTVGGYVVTQVCRLAWPLRMWRFVRFSRAAILLRQALAASAGGLGVHLSIWLIGVVFFAFIVFWAEFQAQGYMRTVPDTLYFTIVTMTTVGYGDITPLTTAGKIFCSISAYFSCVMVMLPIAVFVTNFAKISAVNDA